MPLMLLCDACDVEPLDQTSCVLVLVTPVLLARLFVPPHKGAPSPVMHTLPLPRCPMSLA